MRYLFFISLLGLSIYSQPPSLMELCIAYIKKEQLKGVNALRAQIYTLLPQDSSRSTPEYIEFLQKVLAVFYRKRSLLSMSLTHCEPEYNVPHEIRELFTFNAYQGHLFKDPVLRKFMHRLNEIFINTLQQCPTSSPPDAFTTLRDLSVPPVFHSLLEQTSRTLLAWRSPTFLPHGTRLARFEATPIFKILVALPYVVIVKPDGIAYFPLSKGAPAKTFSLQERFPIIKAHSNTESLAAFTTQEPSTLAIFNPLNPSPILQYHDTHPISAAAFSSDSQLLAIANDAKGITILNSRNCSPFATLELKGTAGQVATMMKALTFSPDKSTLVVGTKDGNLHIFRNHPWRIDHKTHLEGASGYAQSIRFPHNNSDSFFVRHHHTPFVIEYNLTNNKWAERGFYHYRVRSMALSPHGTVLATAGIGPIKIWDREEVKEIHSLGTADTNNRTTYMQFSADGLHLFAGSKMGDVLVYSVDKPAERHIFHAILSHRIMARQSALLPPLLKQSPDTLITSQERGRIAALLKEQKISLE